MELDVSAVVETLVLNGHQRADSHKVSTGAFNHAEGTDLNV